MAKILVADDSAVDRKLIGGLLEKNPRLQVEFVEDGQAALASARYAPPDLLVTDMQMPQMDGLEVVSALHAESSRVPVVLITGQGSEELAVEALSRGAASYVPKSQLAERLLETVSQVLEAARTDHRYERLNECLINNQYTYYLENDPELFSPLVDLVQQALVGAELVDETARVQIGLALEEALMNALFHGNLEISGAKWREARGELCKGLVPPEVRERREKIPYRDRLILVDIQITTEMARFVIGDEGPGFDATYIPRTLVPGGGRGLVLIHTFMDEVRFNAKGNEITMIKRSSRPTQPANLSLFPILDE